MSRGSAPRPGSPRPEATAGRLARSVGALTAGHLGYALSQWLLLLVVARFLGPSGVGDLALGLSVTAPVFLLAGLELRLLMLTDARMESRLGVYARLRGWGGGVATAVSFLIAALLLPDRGVLLVCLLIALCKTIEQWGDLAGAVYQRRDQPWRSLLSQAGRGALALAAVVVTLALGGGLEQAVGIWLLLWFAFAMTFDRAVLGEVRRAVAQATDATEPSAPGHLLRATLAAGAALSIASFLNSLAANLPRLWLARRDTLDALGQFGFASYIVAAASVLLGAVFTGLAPALIEPREGATRTRLLAIGAGGAAATTALGTALVHWQADTIVATLAGPGFERSAAILRIVVWALPFYAVATAGNTLAAAERRGRRQVVAYGATLAATAAALLVLHSGSPPETAARAIVFGSAVQATAVIAGLAVVRSRRP